MAALPASSQLRWERVQRAHGANCTTYAQCNWPLGECRKPPTNFQDVWQPKCWCLPGVYTLFSSGENCQWANSAGAIAGQVILCLICLIGLAITLRKFYLIHKNISKSVFNLVKIILAVWTMFFLFQSLLFICMSLRVKGPTLNVLVQVVLVFSCLSMLAPLLHTCWFFMFTIQMLHSLPSTTKIWAKLAMYTFVSTCGVALFIIATLLAFFGGDSIQSALYSLAALATCFICALLVGGPIWTFFRYYEAPPLLVLELKNVWIIHFALGLITLILMSDYVFMAVWRDRGYFDQNIFDAYDETRGILDFNFFFSAVWMLCFWVVSVLSYNHSKRGHRSIALSDFSDNFDNNRSEIYEAIHKDTTVYESNSDID